MLSQAVKKPLVCCDKLKQATTSRGDHQPEEFEQPRETLRQFCCCTFVLLLPLRFALLLLLAAAGCCVLLCCCCILLLLMLLLHYYSAAAAAFRPAAAAATSLAWEGTNSHNCGLIISSIKTNSTKEISNHDQVTLDLGRLPQACYLGDSGKRDLRKKEVSIEVLEYAQNALGEFGGNNRTGIAGTLHRISAIRNKNGRVVGLTCRLGRPVREIIDMTRDLLEYGKSILFLERLLLTQAMKLEVMDRGAEIADIRESVSIVSLSCSIWIPDVDFQMQIVVETSNEIGGDGDIPHPAIGGARRLQVPDPCMKHKVMIEAVDNHMPEVIILNSQAAKTAKTDVKLQFAFLNLLPTPCLFLRYQRISLHSQSKLQYMDTRCRFSDAVKVLNYWIWREINCVAPMCLYCKVGGLKTVILSDEAARTKLQEIILERRSAPAFPFLRKGLLGCSSGNTSTVEANRAQLLEFGRPGVGKATVIISHVLSYEHLKESDLCFNGFGVLSFFSYFALLLGLTLTFSIWLSRSLSFAAINSNRRPHLGVSQTGSFYASYPFSLTSIASKMAIINREFEQPRRRHCGSFAAALLSCCCRWFLLLLLLNFCAAAAAAVLLLLLLHFSSADAAAALLLCCRCCVSPCCCCSYALLLRFAIAAAVFCCCCSLLRGSNPCSLAWEGTNSHNCGLIISSIKTNSTKEVSNHDQVTLDLGRLPQACYLGDSGKRDLRKKEVSIEELEYAQNALGEFGGNNRTGIAGTLHRISAIRNKNGRVVGLTCRLAGQLEK
ncbi:UNVERIFIED_CONTAM: putative protein ycf45 [Sesamum angustifolium]|uniref:Uncharacterized protein n=1 Tax=Sesamum angustifolium TaxID=2727405 RepID=A0AAW2ILK9_9LAMI